MIVLKDLITKGIGMLWKPKQKFKKKSVKECASA